jgi:hypothetical protein
MRVFFRRKGHVSRKSLELLECREAFGVQQGPPNSESWQPGHPPSWHKACGRVGRLCFSPWHECKCVSGASFGACYGLSRPMYFFYLNEMARSSPALFERKKF